MAQKALILKVISMTLKNSNADSYIYDLRLYNAESYIYDTKDSKAESYIYDTKDFNAVPGLL